MKRKSNKFNIRNVRELLEKRAAEQPQKKFLSEAVGGPGWTYREFDAKVNRVANFLASYGIGKGDVVSLLLPNSAEYVFAYFACFKLGAIAGPVNSLLKGEEVKFVVENSDAKLLLVGSKFLPRLRPLFKPSEMDDKLNYLESEVDDKLDWYNYEEYLPEGHGEYMSAHSHKQICHNDYFSILRTLAGQFSETRKQKNASGANDLPNLENIFVFDDVWKATIDFPNVSPETALDADDEAIIIYTSGTTGKPKGCLLTHGNLIANARQITEWLGFDENDRLLTMMPLFHMNAVSVTTMTALYAGASTVVARKFSASKFWQIISDFKITSFGSVATMLSMLLATYPGGVPEGLENNLRFAMCGSAPVPAEVLRKFEETFNCLVIEGYGLSESTCRSTFNPPNTNRRAGSCGQPIGNEMKVFDENDEEVPNGELGEIVLRGANIFKGYFKNVEATRKAFANGWFHTGDIGYRDEDGFFYIADRKSDMIIRGGENIYPREIDELLFSHPAIQSAAVIGVPDKLYGEEVAAFVVLKESENASEEDLINFCKTRLADYKCPKTIYFVEDIPKGPTGKLLKRELAQMVKSEKLEK